jgi:hypothetical protein
MFCAHAESCRASSSACSCENLNPTQPKPGCGNPKSTSPLASSAAMPQLPGRTDNVAFAGGSCLAAGPIGSRMYSSGRRACPLLLDRRLFGGVIRPTIDIEYGVVGSSAHSAPPNLGPVSNLHESSVAGPL